jgi:hypothetical protein
MSKTIVDRSAVLLGSGDVYVLDAASGNYGNHEAISTKANLLCRMDNVRIHIKKKDTITKQIINGMVMDDEVFTHQMEFFFEFTAYEHNAKTQAVLFGGALTDVSLALGTLMIKPKNLRFEVKFTYPLGNKFMWYILPKCQAVSDFEFSPGNTEGFTTKGVFRALPAVTENAIWYTTATPCFHSYII